MIDEAQGVRSLDGKVAMGTEPGKGTYLQETGRITMDLETYEPLFVAGPHPAFAAGGIDYPMCDALAAG